MPDGRAHANPTLARHCKVTPFPEVSLTPTQLHTSGCVGGVFTLLGGRAFTFKAAQFTREAGALVRLNKLSA